MELEGWSEHCVYRDGLSVLGTHTVIHPKAQIIAEAGPIIIGESNLIEEQTQIINRSVLEILYL